MKAVAIRANGTIEDIEIDSDLASLQKAVGGYIEVLQMTPEVHAYLDEEGKLKGKEPNVMATMLCKKLKIGLLPGDIIAGDMILFGTTDENETCCVDIPDNFIADNELLEYVLKFVK
jgi:hypothetical protein